VFGLIPTLCIELLNTTTGCHTSEHNIFHTRFIISVYVNTQQFALCAAVPANEQHSSIICRTVKPTRRIHGWITISYGM